MSGDSFIVDIFIMKINIFIVLGENADIDASGKPRPTTRRDKIVSSSIVLMNYSPV